ncbi:hypothetical protein JZU56_04420, partial [bacterium]|nr:hypothetical protein [bacterium]
MQTLLDMEKIDITTGRTMSAREIEKRIEIADSTNSAGVASALEHAPDRETRFLIMRHAMLDTDATAELVEKQVETAARLLEAQLDQFKLTALVDPDKAKINLGHATVAAEKATAEREAMQAMFDAGQVPESFVLDAVAKETERLRVADAFQRTGGNDWMGGTDEATRYMVDEIAVKALAKDEYAQRALSDNIAGSLVTAEKGFSSNTRLGRAVSARRGRQARAAYEWQMTSKSGFHADVFGNKGLKRTLMVLRHWGSTINAAYYVHTGGTGAMDSATEVGAVVDGLKMYAGKGVNKVLPDGQSILVGGVDA